MSMSNYLEKKLLDHVLGVATYTPPTSVYVAFFTVAPDDTGGGTEVTGGGYARKAVPFAATVLGAGTATSNAGAPVTLPACTVVAVALMDAATAGNMLWAQTLPTSKTYTAGDIEPLAAGSIVVALD